MAIEQWSDEVRVARLRDDPALADDLETLLSQLEQRPTDVVLDFSEVSFVSSSNLADLLRLRNALKEQQADDRRIVLSGVSPKIQNALTITGIDKLFEHTSTLPLALAALQLD